MEVFQIFPNFVVMKQIKATRYTISLLLLILIPYATVSANPPDTVVLNRMFRYAEHIHPSDTVRTGVYIKYEMDVIRKNPILMCIPTLYHVFRAKQRHFLCEEYTEVSFLPNCKTERDRKSRFSNIRKNRTTLPVILRYLTPHIYQTTIFDNDILSPFDRHNASLYRYLVLPQFDGHTWLVFKPKTVNTQTVKGQAVIDTETGQILSAKFEGEYDHIKFSLDITLGDEGVMSLLPSSCSLQASFAFLGNKMKGNYHAVYGVKVPEGYSSHTDRELIEKIRPDSLTDDERHIYAVLDSATLARKVADSIAPHPARFNFAKDVLWDVIGDRLINRTRGHFAADKGYYRISPLLNPLYFGYSNRKGMYYRFHFRSSYDIDDNRELAMRLKAGYSFKLRQLYFTLPFIYRFNKSRDGYVEFEIGNGNRIFNSTVIEKVKAEKGDDEKWEDMDLDYFKDFHLSLSFHDNLSERLGILVGMRYHKRTAINKVGFIEADRPLHYYSFAPLLEVQFRPKGMFGPVFTLDYERGLKGIIRSNQQYERWEFDLSQIIHLPVTRRVAYRIGGGFYTTRVDNVYFLDYSNFKEDNISGGWHDDWTGEFELLNRNWYNASKYYLRANMTFESPLMILSRLPLIGSIMEKERIYFSALHVPEISNYFELGYGFTNRLFSAGAFVSLKEGHYESFGIKLGFELFDNW